MSDVLINDLLPSSLKNDNDDPILQPDVSFYAEGRLWIAGRGSEPVSAVRSDNFLATARPGLYSISMGEGCLTPSFVDGVDRVIFTEPGHTAPGIEPDVHGAWMVGDEVWAVDQAGTGSLVDFEWVGGVSLAKQKQSKTKGRERANEWVAKFAQGKHSESEGRR